MELHQKIAPAEPGLKSHREIEIPRCARGAKRGCARTKGKLHGQRGWCWTASTGSRHAVETKKAPSITGG
jgi:hypothetical protein